MNTSRNIKISGGIAGVLILLSTSTAWAHCGGNHGPGHPHCGGGGSGPGDPVYSAESLDLGIDPLDSNSVDNETTVRFRGANLELGQFVGNWSVSGLPCNHGSVTGSFSILAADPGNPYTAHLTSYFQSELDSGDIKTHYLFMEGEFDEPDNWPPSVDDPVTTVTFDYWEIYAENKKAQRNDCDGESPSVPDPNGSWTITVELQ